MLSYILNGDNCGIRALVSDISYESRSVSLRWRASPNTSQFLCTEILSGPDVYGLMDRVFRQQVQPVKIIVSRN
jgi:hypothetical protein